MVPTNIQTLIDNASSSVSNLSGANLNDFFNLGFYFVKLALGAVLGFVVAYWPLELILVILGAVVLIARRSKNHTGR